MKKEIKSCTSFKKWVTANLALVLFVCYISLFFSGCKKFVEVDELTNKLLAEQVFESENTTEAAFNGIYKILRSSNFTNSALLTNCLVSDEIVPYANNNTDIYVTNKLVPTDVKVSWSFYYEVIYQVNNAIEKLTVSKGISENSKRYYLSEAKFIRALCYFYLTNLYGDVPLILNTDVKDNNTMPRTISSQVYAQIISDLKDAQTALSTGYSISGGERIRANKWAAKALLARAYLYLKDYASAENEANDVINSGAYSLLNGPAGIFNKNNTEAILQLANTPTTEANAIASNFIYTVNPIFICSSFLLNAFESGDQRKSTWIKTQTYSGQPISYPFKFTTTATASNEYFTVLRLAELYLIRAEAKAMRNDFQGCIDDINLIRQKHGGLNTPLPAPANQSAAMDVILHERQVDLFTEGMHRWFDLKRTGRLDVVMLAEKPATWQSYAALYPIPFTDIQRNPNLKQNPGYE